ncbi:MAG: hypothetical protein ACREHG_09390, partial [Candidatus Saccharimonadales bacterium]
LPVRPWYVVMVNFMSIGALISAILSVVPIIPALLIWAVYAVEKHDKEIFGFILPEANLALFFEMWLVMSVIVPISTYILNKLNSAFSVTRVTRPKYTLSADQLSFMAIFYCVKELKSYFVSYVDEHVENAQRSLRAAISDRTSYVFGGAEFTASVGNIEEMHHPENPGNGISEEFEKFPVFNHITGFPSLPEVVRVANEFSNTLAKYRWFSFDRSMRKQVESFINIKNKLLNRLVLRKDLADVLKALNAMAGYIYAYLPEHAAHKGLREQNELDQYGRECFSAYMGVIETLPYVEEEKQKRVTKIEEKKNKIIEKISRSYRDYLAIRFVSWFLTMIVLSSVIAYLFLEIFFITPDTMALIVIGSSITAAAALAAFSPIKKDESK